MGFGKPVFGRWCKRGTGKSFDQLGQRLARLFPVAMLHGNLTGEVECVGYDFCGRLLLNELEQQRIGLLNVPCSCRILCSS